MNASAPVLSLRGVTHEFGAGRSFWQSTVGIRAVDDISLDIVRGEMLGIVGESGSGKTTLSKIMLGLISPTAGTVELEGRPIGSLSNRDIAARVQFVFQDPYSSLNPRHTVGRAISQPLLVRGIGDAAERRRRALEMLGVVGLSSRFLDAYPGQMSGGQRQRVAIARALVMRPEILICDEPTSALDVSVQAQILNLLLELRREFGLTLVIVSHNMAVIRHMTTRVGVMLLGRMVELDRSERIFAEPRHPYTRLLLDSALTVAPGAGVPDVHVDGATRHAMRDGPVWVSNQC